MVDIRFEFDREILGDALADSLNSYADQNDFHGLESLVLETLNSPATLENQALLESLVIIGTQVAQINLIGAETYGEIQTLVETQNWRDLNVLATSALNSPDISDSQKDFYTTIQNQSRLQDSLATINAAQVMTASGDTDALREMALDLSTEAPVGTHEAYVWNQIFLNTGFDPELAFTPDFYNFYNTDALDAELEIMKQAMDELIANNDFDGIRTMVAEVQEAVSSSNDGQQAHYATRFLEHTWESYLGNIEAREASGELAAPEEVGSFFNRSWIYNDERNYIQTEFVGILSDVQRARELGHHGVNTNEVLRDMRAEALLELAANTDITYEQPPENITEQELLSNPNWMRSSITLALFFGDNIVDDFTDAEITQMLSGQIPDSVMADADRRLTLSQYGLNTMGQDMFNLASTVINAGRYSENGAPTQAMLAGRDLYEALPNFTAAGTGRALYGIVSDPTTYLGVGLLFKGVTAVKAAAPTTVRTVITGAGIGAFEGLVYGTADDAARQQVEIAGERLESMDFTRLAISGGIGTLAGGTLGGGVTFVGSKIARAFGGSADEAVARQTSAFTNDIQPSVIADAPSAPTPIDATPSFTIPAADIAPSAPANSTLAPAALADAPVAPVASPAPRVDTTAPLQRAAVPGIQSPMGNFGNFTARLAASVDGVEGIGPSRSTPNAPEAPAADAAPSVDVTPATPASTLPDNWATLDAKAKSEHLANLPHNELISTLNGLRTSNATEFKALFKKLDNGDAIAYMSALQQTDIVEFNRVLLNQTAAKQRAITEGLAKLDTTAAPAASPAPAARVEPAAETKAAEPAPSVEPAASPAPTTLKPGAPKDSLPALNEIDFSANGLSVTPVTDIKIQGRGLRGGDDSTKRIFAPQATDRFSEIRLAYTDQLLGDNRIFQRLKDIRDEIAQNGADPSKANDVLALRTELAGIMSGMDKKLASLAENVSNRHTRLDWSGNEWGKLKIAESSLPFISHYNIFKSWLHPKLSGYSSEGMGRMTAEEVESFTNIVDLERRYLHSFWKDADQTLEAAQTAISAADPSSAKIIDEVIADTGSFRADIVKTNEHARTTTNRENNYEYSRRLSRAVQQDMGISKDFSEGGYYDWRVREFVKFEDPKNIELVVNNEIKNFYISRQQPDGTFRYAQPANKDVDVFTGKISEAIRMGYEHEVLWAFERAMWSVNSTVEKRGNFHDLERLIEPIKKTIDDIVRNRTAPENQDAVRAYYDGWLDDFKRVYKESEHKSGGLQGYSQRLRLEDYVTRYDEWERFRRFPGQSAASTLPFPDRRVSREGGIYFLESFQKPTLKWFGYYPTAALTVAGALVMGGEKALGTDTDYGNMIAGSAPLTWAADVTIGNMIAPFTDHEISLLGPGVISLNTAYDAIAGEDNSGSTPPPGQADPAGGGSYITGDAGNAAPPPPPTDDTGVQTAESSPESVTSAPESDSVVETNTDVAGVEQTVVQPAVAEITESGRPATPAAVETAGFSWSDAAQGYGGGYWNLDGLGSVFSDAADGSGHMLSGAVDYGSEVFRAIPEFVDNNIAEGLGKPAQAAAALLGAWMTWRFASNLYSNVTSISLTKTVMGIAAVGIGLHFLGKYLGGQEGYADPINTNSPERAPENGVGGTTLNDNRTGSTFTSDASRTLDRDTRGASLEPSLSDAANNAFAGTEIASLEADISPVSFAHQGNGSLVSDDTLASLFGQNYVSSNDSAIPAGFDLASATVASFDTTPHSGNLSIGWTERELAAENAVIAAVAEDTRKGPVNFAELAHG